MWTHSQLVIIIYNKHWKWSMLESVVSSALMTHFLPPKWLLRAWRQLQTIPNCFKRLFFKVALSCIFFYTSLFSQPLWMTGWVGHHRRNDALFSERVWLMAAQCRKWLKWRNEMKPEAVLSVSHCDKLFPRTWKVTVSRPWAHSAYIQPDCECRHELTKRVGFSLCIWKKKNQSLAALSVGWYLPHLPLVCVKYH